MIFAADVLVVACTAWLGVCAAGLDRRGLVEGLLGWGLLSLAWVAGSGALLGLVGALGPAGFLMLHAVVMAGALVWRRGEWRQDLQRAREWLAKWPGLWRSGTPEGYLALGLTLVMAGLAVLAARAEPVVYDSLTYRLSRIGAWLQDGWIRHFATDDPRLNYMPAAPDIVIAWLLGATDEGYQLAPLSQLTGGILLLGATFGLARTIGLSCLQALAAVGLLLGMANVAVQFTTTQSDLFTAGVFAAGYLLWHRSWLRGEGSWVSGVGVALAFGSKGTMFYLAPGAAIWVGWLVWQHREKWRALRPTAGGFFLAALILVVPDYWRNQVTYGSLFGPRDAVVLHHGSFDSPAQHAEKLAKNLGTSAVQLFEPTAQPFWLQDASRAIAVKLTASLAAEADPYVFIGQTRRDQLERVLRLTAPDADVVTCGLIGTICFLAGVAVAIARPRRAAASQILVWSAGVIAYLLTQHALVQWHHWAFRFMVLVSPWVAVIGAWAIVALSGRWRIAVWTVTLGSAAQLFVVVQARASQAAWQAGFSPKRSASYHQYGYWRSWAEQLDQPDASLVVALPIDRPLAAFYRGLPARPVVLRRLSALDVGTAEAALGSDEGWLLVPAKRFLGQEGRVMGRMGPFNLAGYRRLRPGEHPRPMIYANRLFDRGGELRRELLLRTWPDAPVRLELFNPAPTEIRFVARTPIAEVTGMLAAGERRTWDIPVPADMPAVVTIDFPKKSDPDFTTTAVMVQLAP